MKKNAICLFLLIINVSAFGEFRLWKDKAGNEYEAEYVREMFDKVTLRTVRGEEVRVRLDTLSEHDQKYLRVKVPPNIKIDFSKRTKRKPKPVEMGDLDNDTTDILYATVTIAKESKRAFTSGLIAELFLIGKEVDGTQGEYMILLSKTEKSFLLPEKRGDIYTFKADPITLKVYTEYNGTQRRGHEYIGYLVVVSDRQGNPVQIETNLSWLKSKVPELRELYQRGAASVYSRYFDKETIKKLKVPHTLDYASRN